MKSRVVFFILLIAVSVVLLARFHVAIVRFFDPDEFAHLHWAWLMAQGKLPYRDFFFYATPLFQWFLFPLFKLPPSDLVLLLARLWEFALYLINVCYIFRITQLVTKSYIVPALSILIFVTFPMTFDKTIDIRPDFLMLLPYLIAIERLLAWPVLTIKRVLTVGLFFGSSFLIFFKIIYALPAAILLLGFKRHSLTVYPEFAEGQESVLQDVAKTLIIFSLGFLLPIGLFLVYLFTNNLQALAWNTFTHTQFVVNTGKQTFSLFATLSPWPLVYVSKGGISIPWLVNMGVWISAIGGIVILWKQHKPFALFSACFAFPAVLFLVFFPAPYVQYFIPLSAIASILSAISIQNLEYRMQNIERKFRFIIPHSLFFILYSLFLFSFFLQYRDRISPASNNEEQLGVIRDVLAISKPTDTFYDMVGSYVFRPDGYFICCHPYAEFVDKLKAKPPTLPQSLISNNTHFLILDRTGQSLWKPKKEDLDFLKANFIQSKYRKIYIRNQ